MNLHTINDRISFCGEVISILDNEGRKSVNIKIESSLMKAELSPQQEIHLGDKLTLRGRFIIDEIENNQTKNDKSEID